MIFRRIFSFIFGLAVIMTLCSAKISDIYRSHHTDNGWIYFIYKQKIPAADKHSDVKSVDFDYTYVEEDDSITFLSTISLKNVEKPEKITFKYGDSIYTNIPEQIYIRARSNKMEYRLKIVMPYNFWDSMYNFLKPFELIYTFKSDNKTVDYRFAYSSKKWNEHREKIREINKLIKLSVNKK